MKRKKIIRLLLSSLVLVGSLIVGNQGDNLRAAEVSQPLVETEQVTTEELVSNPAELLGKDLFQPRATIEEIWPGQSMMLEEYHLNDDDWQSIKIVNSADSLTTFPINVEGYDEGVLVGHIRFGGVNRQTGKFEIDKAKQLRNLVFIVENTQKFKDKEKKVTVKYTYNYYQGTNSTYTMVPITAMKQAGTTHEIPNDPNNAFEVPQGGQTVSYRTVKELYIQKVPGTETFAIQARTDKNQGISNVDFYFQQIKTLIPTVDGGVRIVNEIKNTGWRAGMASKMPRKTFGVMLGEDTMLNDIDEVPIFSLGTNKGVYIANNLDLFRVAFPRLNTAQGAADNYEGQAFNSVIAKTNAAFQQKPDGFGNEGQDLPLDTRVWPASGIKPPLSGTGNDPINSRGYDTQYVQKWNPRQPPEVDEKAIMSYDVTVLPIYKPEIRLSEESLNQSVHKDQTLTFNGSWRDLDSLNVTLYYKIESKDKAGWIELKKDGRDDSEEQKEAWFDFSFELPASSFKLNGDSISFKAVDTTQVDSDIVKTNVTTFEKITIKTEHYGPDGKKMDESSVQATPGVGNTYTTEPNDYTDQGLTLDESKTIGKVSGEVPNEDVLVKYFYKEGIVKVITHYLKEDEEELLPSEEVLYKYNDTYITNDRVAEAKALDYYLKESEGEVSGSTGKIDKTIEVTYYYRIGVLGLVDVVKTFDFGEQDLISMGTKEIYPQNNTSIEVLDELRGDWSITLRISDSLKTTAGKELMGQFFFNPKTGEPIELNDVGKPIYSRENISGGQYKVEWEAAKKEGLVFKQAVGNQNSAYSGELEWNIVSAP